MPDSNSEDDYADCWDFLVPHRVQVVAPLPPRFIAKLLDAEAEALHIEIYAEEQGRLDFLGGALDLQIERYKTVTGHWKYYVEFEAPVRKNSRLQAQFVFRKAGHTHFLGRARLNPPLVDDGLGGKLASNRGYA